MTGTSTCHGLGKEVFTYMGQYKSKKRTHGLTMGSSVFWRWLSASRSMVQRNTGHGSGRSYKTTRRLTIPSPLTNCSAVLDFSTLQIRLDLNSPIPFSLPILFPLLINSVIYGRISIPLPPRLPTCILFRTSPTDPAIGVQGSSKFFMLHLQE